MSTPMRPNATTPPADSQPTSRQVTTVDLYAEFARQVNQDSRGLRLSLAVAAVIHGILLLITFPALYSNELQPAEQPKDLMRLAPTPRFRQQPPPPKEAPKPRARRVPIPDPTPDAPEPLVVETPVVELDMPPIDGLALAIPEKPPQPEPPGPINLHGGVVRPKRLHYVEPQYTEMARTVRRQGVVILQTVIDTEGRVRDIKVLKDLGFGLTDSAVDAVSQWTFEPALLNGKPVMVYFNLTVSFHLQ